MLWHGAICGPADSVYEGAIFSVEVSIPSDFPLAPPRLKFTNFVPMHPNISADSVCLSLFNHDWSPAYTLFSMMVAVRSLLTDLNWVRTAHAMDTRCTCSRTALAIVAAAANVMPLASLST